MQPTMIDQELEEIVIVSNLYKNSNNVRLHEYCDSWTLYILQYMCAVGNITYLSILIRSLTLLDEDKETNNIINEIYRKYELAAIAGNVEELDLKWEVVPLNILIEERKNDVKETWHELLPNLILKVGAAIIARDRNISIPYIELIKLDVFAIIFHNTKTPELSACCDFLTAYVISYACACGDICALHSVIKALTIFKNYVLSDILKEIFAEHKNDAVKGIQGKLLISFNFVPIHKLIAYNKDENYKKPWTEVLGYFIKLSAQVLVEIALRN